MRDPVLLLRCPQPERPAAWRLRSRLEDRVVAEPAAATRLGGDPAAAGPPDDPDREAAPWPDRRRGGRGRGRRRSALRGAPPAARRGPRAASRCSRRRSRSRRRSAGCARPGRRRARRPRGRSHRRGSAGRVALAPDRAFSRAFASNVAPVSSTSSSTPRSSSVTSSARSSERSSRSSASLCGDRVATSNLGRRPGHAQRFTVARISVWAANRRSSPDDARSMSPSIAVRSNGLPSAVPWTSTKVPASVPTTLKSTSARESSL